MSANGGAGSRSDCGASRGGGARVRRSVHRLRSGGGLRPPSSNSERGGGLLMPIVYIRKIYITVRNTDHFTTSTGQRIHREQHDTVHTWQGLTGFSALEM